MQRDQLRQALLRSRRSIPKDARWLAAGKVARNLRQWPAFRKATRVASYHAVGAELGTEPVHDLIQQLGKTLFLPVVSGHQIQRLSFHQVSASGHWCLNRYGIPEPAIGRDNPRVNPAFLDLILVPLVGFDAQGNRMGMGAGYYDRSLAFRRHRKHWRHPRLVGLAFASQQVETLPVASWDVPLDAVVTEDAIITPH